MNKTIYQPHYWNYLTGDFLNRIHAPLRKMKIPDALIIKYYNLCTDVHPIEVARLQNALDNGTNPRDVKMLLAHEISELYAGKEAAGQAEERFKAVYQQNQMPEDAPVLNISASEEFLDGVQIIDALVQGGYNHQGSLDTALEMVRIAKNYCGVSAVKFQKRDNESLFTQEFSKKPYTGQNSFGATYGEHRAALELSETDFCAIRDLCWKLEADLMVTPFDKKSVDFLDSIGIRNYKIASAMRQYATWKGCEKLGFPCNSKYLKAVSIGSISSVAKQMLGEKQSAFL